ncbi:MAG: hypothetical protein B6226_02745 [Candidatus Cloacimonetes bacterium 4572_65]|nr:MAG: hypothetical protein B6226_02745 [Candidatus Cloacimonetes bacterium 4572_65]
MGYKIVIVDDEPHITESIQAQLEAITDEYDIHCFNFAYAALKEVFKGDVDLVISDIAMPDMDGYTLYSRIKNEKPNVPVIMMTGFGYDPNHVLVNCQKLGRLDVLLKPFPIEKLLMKIKMKLR